MDRVTIPEEREQLSSQKSLGTATNLNLFAYRRFGAWTLSLSVRNVANNSAPFRAGYQPSRVIVGESDYANSYRPQGARYQHLYPRHAYLSVAYEF
jgi:outer membrane receptor protein involved in Fe transport